MAGYTRQDTADNIANGNVIDATDLDNEFNQVQSAFNSSTGHTHDGTAGEGAPIEAIGPSQDVVATASTLRPKNTNTVDLGTASTQYKDLYIDGVANIDSLVADTADIDGGTIDGATIGGTTAAAITGTTITGTSLVGPVTGNVTGNLTGDVTGDVTGNVTGDVTGNADTATALATARTIGGVSFDGSANIDLPGVNTAGTQNTTGSAATLTTARNFSLTGDVTATAVSFDGSGNVALATTLGDVALGTDTTGSYVESLVAGTGVTLTNNTGEGATPTVAIGQAVATDSDVSFNDVTVAGNLTVSGTTSTVNSTNTTMSDQLIELGNGRTGTPAGDAGIVIERGDSSNAFIGYDESADKFTVGTGTFTGSSTGNLSITTGTLVANVEGNVTGDVTGNADTTTALATSRDFSLTGDVTATAVGFDGSGNVALSTAIGSGVIVNDDINASAAIADTKLATISTSGKVSNSATTATDANTASAIVARDSSGDFSAGVVTGTQIKDSDGDVRVPNHSSLSASTEITASGVYTVTAAATITFGTASGELVAGDIVVIYNEHSAGITIEDGDFTTFVKDGESTDNTSVTLAANSLATITVLSSTKAVIASGNI